MEGIGAVCCIVSLSRNIWEPLGLCRWPNRWIITGIFICVLYTWDR
jgi:hypothetical protein